MAKVKNFFIKTGRWFKNHAPTKRRLIQLYAALLTNANIKGFVNGRIYTGATKNVCVPGMNCYSCPGAVGACPLGSLQDSLAQSNNRAPFYILGILALFGLMFARTICGFFCPVGLGQELLYKVKTPKVKKSRFTRLLSYLKYVLLVVFVIAVPLIYNGIPGFCKYICPAGTFGGSLPLLAHSGNGDFYDALGYLFTWKFALLVVFIILCIFFYRFFCRFVCPLGAIYGFFNKFALIGVKLDKEKCVDCGLCINTCKMDIKHVGDHECINCGECIPACPTKAITWKGSQIFLHGIEVPAAEDKPEGGIKVAAAVAVNTESAMTVGSADNNVILNESEESHSDTDMTVGSFGKPQDDKEHEQNDFEVYKAKVKKRAFWLQFSAWAVAIAVLIGALVYFNFIDTAEAVQTYKVGDTCPDFTLSTVYETAGSRDENGNVLEEFTLSDYRGKVVVLNFWYTTCDPCKAELPYFNQAKTDYGDDIVIAVIHSATIRGYVQEIIDDENGINASDWGLIFTHDTKEVNIYEQLGGKDAYPMTAIIDANGVITFTWANSLEKDYLYEQIDKALEVEYVPEQ